MASILISEIGLVIGCTFSSWLVRKSFGPSDSERQATFRKLCAYLSEVVGLEEESANLRFSTSNSFNIAVRSEFMKNNYVLQQ